MKTIEITGAQAILIRSLLREEVKAECSNLNCQEDNCQSIRNHNMFIKDAIRQIERGVL